VRLNTTTRRYLHAIAKLPDYRWLEPPLPRLENSGTANAVANQIRARDAELAAMLRTTVSPTMLSAGIKINVIPNTAEAQLDIRRLPNETQRRILERVRRMVHDPAVEVRARLARKCPRPSPAASRPALRGHAQTFTHTAPPRS